jgi:imidazolonepropionase-like amidohydrolase
MTTTTIITGATVIDGTGAPPRPNAAIVIEDERIAEVADRFEAPTSGDSVQLDAAGAYVIPGLMDGNAHLVSLLPDVLIEFRGRYDELIEEAVQVTLRAGVTTVFDTWGPLAPLVAVRDRITGGSVVGSRMFVAGNIIGFDGPLSADFTPAGKVFGRDTVAEINGMYECGVGSDLMWRSPREVRERTAAYIAEGGMDFVKYAASGHGLAFSPFITFSQRVQNAIVEEAHAAGITVQGHSTTVESLQMEVEAGVDLLQHGEWTGPEPLPDETIAAIVDRRIPIGSILTTRRHQDWVEEHGDDRTRRLVFNRVRVESSRRLIAAGARMLLTSDGFVAGARTLAHPALDFLFDRDDPPNLLGASHLHWLRAAVEHGMAPMEALLSATRYLAEAYGKAAEIGSLEPGKRADLVVLDADPLADPANYGRVRLVMKDGTRVDRDRLPERRILSGLEREPPVVVSTRPAAP